jgi:hypothetical protein
MPPRGVNRSGDARYPVRTEPLPTTLIVALYRRIEAYRGTKIWTPFR